MFFNKSKKLLAEAKAQLIIKQGELESAKSIISIYSTLVDKDQYLKSRETAILHAENKLQELNARFKLALTVHERLENQVNLRVRELMLTDEYGPKKVVEKERP